jgi:hypothetical protein
MTWTSSTQTKYKYACAHPEYVCSDWISMYFDITVNPTQVKITQTKPTRLKILALTPFQPKTNLA